MRILLFLLSFSVVFSTDIQIKAGWNFIGFNKNIILQDDPLLSSSRVKVIFTYKNRGSTGNWGAYSSNQAVRDQLNSHGITPISNIYSFEGVWLNANVNFTYSQPIVVPQFDLDNNPDNGWSLRSSVDGLAMDVDSIKQATLVIVSRNGQWLAKGYGVEAAGYGELNTIMANEAYWMYKTSERLNNRLVALIRGTMPVLPGANFGNTNTLINPHQINGGLHLVPTRIQRIVQEQITEKDQMDPFQPKPLTKPIEVEVDESSNQYEITTVPVGTDYSLVFVDGQGNGVKIDSVDLSPEETKEIDIPTPEPTGNAVFTIQSLLSSEALSGAQVIISETSQGFYTNAEGIVSVIGLPHGTYTAIVHREGFASKTIDFSVESTLTTTLPLINLDSRRGKLAGSVLSTNPNRSNIMIYVKSVDGSVYTTLTNRSGNYFFNGLPEGDGYSLIVFDIGYDVKKVSNVEVKQDETTVLPSIIIEKKSDSTGSIAGFVRFSEVQHSFNHAGIIISIEGTDLEAISSRDGAFVLNNILPGLHTLNFTDSNHVTFTRRVYVKPKTTTHLDSIALIPKTGTVKGKVVDESGEAVSNANVLIKTPSSTYNGITDSEGLFTIGDILTGIYQLTVAKDGHTEISKYISIRQNQITDISLTPLVITRKIMTGTINLMGTEDHSGALVALIGGFGQLAVTDQSGNFTLYGVSLGNYQLQITKNGYITQTIPVTILVDGNYSLPYTPILELSQGEISGIATLENKSDHSGIRVEISGTNFNTFTDSLGKWTLKIPVGNYSNTLRFIKANYGTVNINQSFSVLENGIYAIESQSLTQVSQTLKGTVVVAGRATYENAEIEIIGTSDQSIGTSVSLMTPQDGKFEINNLPLGEYLLIITYDSGEHEQIVRSFVLDTQNYITDLQTLTLRTSYLQINNDDAYTNTSNVSLSLGNSGASKFTITENGVTSEKFSMTPFKDFILSSVDGTKTVTITFFDINDNEIASASDDIILDTTITKNSFSVTANATKGDLIRVSLDIGETGGRVIARLPGIYEYLKLFDNGLNGDTTPNDGVYERTIIVDTSFDTDTQIEASVVDIAQNSVTLFTDNNLLLSTAPTISSVRAVSNADSGEIVLSFATDEPTTSTLFFGIASDQLNSTQTISTSFSTNHSLTLTGLTGGQIYYFGLMAADLANNTTEYLYQTKLAPSAPQNLVIEGGNAEIGLVWNASSTEDVAGYNIYRATDAVFSKINTTILTQTWYLDENLTNNVAHQYKLTAVNDNNIESEYSITVATTPSNNLVGPSNVSGIINSNAIWLSSKSPYNINANSKLTAGHKLYILPGSEVVFNGNHSFVVEGDATVKGYGKANQRLNIRSVEGVEGDFVGQSDIYYADISNVKSLTSLHHSTATVKNLTINTVMNSSVSFDYDYYNCSIGSIKNSDVTGPHRGDGAYEFGNCYVNRTENSTLFKLRIMNDSTYSMISSTCEQCGIFGQINASNSIFRDSYFATSEIGKFNWLLNNSYSSNKYKFAYNYLAPNDIAAIKANLPTNQKHTGVYPLISGEDLFTADRDSDGIPDYIDNDGDGDGYSDKQEIEESDPNFGVIYDPIDANSHPNSVPDNDFDGTADTEDTDDDNDGLSDSDEIMYGTSQLIVDTDGDGSNDLEEITYKYDPLDNSKHPFNVDQTAVNIDNTNVNSDGYIYFIGALTLDEISINAGATILIDKSAQVEIINSTLNGTKDQPLILRTFNGGGGNLALINSKVSHANINNFDNIAFTGSTITYSDLGIDTGNFDTGTVVMNCMLYATWVTSNNGAIYNSYIRASVFSNYGVLENSYISNSLNSRSANMKNVFVNSVNIYEDLRFDNSVINSYWIYNSNLVKTHQSDFKLNGGVVDNLFFDSSYIFANQGYYDGLGNPADLLGDGFASTQFEINGTNYTVDGITNPRSTPNFPDWVNDPSVKQYFWDPTNVGALWDSSNPDVFPEP